MRKLRLNKDNFAIVDNDSFEYLSQWKWSFSSGYAKRQEYLGIEKGKRKHRSIFLHRVVLNAPAGKQVDHINRNPLDNRRENLRIVTASQNQHNRKISRRNKSGVNGVYWHKQRQRWHVQIMYGLKKKSLGLFESINDASLVAQEYERSMKNIWYRENL